MEDILDIGCVSLVCGDKWLEAWENITGLTLPTTPCSRIFVFRNSGVLKAFCEVLIPIELGGIGIRTSVVKGWTAMLVSREAMSSAKMKLDVSGRSCTMTLKENAISVPLRLTDSGHLVIPMFPGRKRQGEAVLATSELSKVTWSNTKEAENVVNKLHLQFGHAHPKVLEKMNGRAYPDAENEVVKDVVAKFRWEVCEAFQKPPAAPIVTLPPAAKFNDRVAMDLVKIASSWVLHMICVFTKLNIAAVVADKTSKCIQRCFIMSWIAHYGVPREIRTDLGPEFDSHSMRSLCERLGIEVTTAPGEAHWTMGVIERQHKTLCIGVSKHMAEGLSLDEALALTTTAMRSHELKGGYSPF